MTVAQTLLREASETVVPESSVIAGRLAQTFIIADLRVNHSAKAENNGLVHEKAHGAHEYFPSRSAAELCARSRRGQVPD